MLSALAVLTGILLATANGANDNFKGVATLFGSGAASYRAALVIATVATAFGSLAALVVARGLIAAFSGNGFVSTELARDPAFSGAVGLGAASTVVLASRYGLPISTTHALTGSLIGAGLAASGATVNGSYLLSDFFLPLMASPVIAVVLTTAAWQARTFWPGGSASSGVCLCLRDAVSRTGGFAGEAVRTLTAEAVPSVRAHTIANCTQRGQVPLFSLDGRTAHNVAHYVSAGAVSFARGLNDTPKIAALMLTVSALGATPALLAVGFAIAVGGILGARPVADTLSTRITALDVTGGLTANIVTSVLVIGASGLTLPVSTTHVSCGALFGIGAVSGSARWRVIRQILLAWLVTLPLAGIFAGVSMFATRALLQ